MIPKMFQKKDEKRWYGIYQLFNLKGPVYNCPLEKNLPFYGSEAPWVHGGIGWVQERFNPIPQKLRVSSFKWPPFPTHMEDKDHRQGTLLDHLDERH